MATQLTDEELFSALDAEQHHETLTEAAHSLGLVIPLFGKGSKFTKSSCVIFIEICVSSLIKISTPPFR